MPAGVGYPNPLQMLGVPNYAPGRMHFAPMQAPQFAPVENQSIFANPMLGGALQRFMFNLNRPQVPGVRTHAGPQTFDFGGPQMDLNRVAPPQGAVDPALMRLFAPQGLGFGAGLY